MGSNNEFEHICQRRKRNGNPPREWPILSKIFSCFTDTAEPDVEIYRPRSANYSDNTVLIDISKILKSDIHYNVDHIPKS